MLFINQDLEVIKTVMYTIKHSFEPSADGGDCVLELTVMRGTRTIWVSRWNESDLDYLLSSFVCGNSGYSTPGECVGWG